MGVVADSITAWHEGRITEDQLIGRLAELEPAVELDPAGEDPAALWASVDTLGWALPAQDSWREIVQMVDRGVLPLSVYDRLSQRVEQEGTR